MDPALPWWLIPSFFAVAVLYASVGHGGASGYLAILSLLPSALNPDQMATTALSLNVLVAGTSLAAFSRTGHFSGSLTWPFLIASIPAAFLGGLMQVSVRLYALLLAASLAIAAGRLILPMRHPVGERVPPPGLAVALPMGGAIGWLSGVVGVGGGIFLSPLLLLAHWADAKHAAAASACFILVNSGAALAGRFTRGALDYGAFWPVALAAFAGGLLGSRLGANHFSGALLKRLLAVVLVVASVKLVRLLGS